MEWCRIKAYEYYKLEPENADQASRHLLIVCLCSVYLL